METSAAKLKRVFGYDILINTFEPFLRKFVSDEVFLVHYGDNWEENVPQGVINELLQTKQIQSIEEYSLEDFSEELTFLNLKDLLVASDHFKLAKSLFEGLSKDKFIELMDNLNSLRRKIAHAKSTFSELDLLTLIEQVRMLSQGEKGAEIRQYLQNEAYKNAKDMPPTFFEEYDIPNNLPPESYDLDGGFVGREKEIRAIRNFIKSDQDRVITITGAGGVGKTAIALRAAYSFLADPKSPFSAVVWFSAKASKLTDEGIRALVPGIKSHDQFIIDILTILDPDALQNFKSARVPIESYCNHLNNFFSANKCLLIVDNLETIIKDDSLIRFIEEVPRPSQVLITSRKGLGEFERRYPIADMPERDAVQLFRTIAKERTAKDLLRLKETTITELVKKVRCYPLLIKWAIGQVCLGKDITKAFSQISVGESEIAKFVFNDVFALLSENSKSILFSMIVYGDKPVTRYVLMHLSNLDDDQFEDAIKELALTSFVFPESRESESGPITEYTMLELTRGFIETRLDDDERTRQMLIVRLHHLSEQIQEFEKSKSSYFQSLYSLGIKSPEGQVAFNYVKAAKNFYYNGDVENAEKNFELAMKIAPTLSYVLTEFSKFKYARKHITDALKLAEKAVKVNPDSFHAWFNYGIMLEKTRKDRESIVCLQKAKELNPQHLPIFTELGRVFSFVGEYEKAEAEFVGALKEEKYPNYRHKLITFHSASENYRRWSEAFRDRRDLEGEIRMLDKALEAINEAAKINPRDRMVGRTYHDICIDLGIAHARKDGFESGKPYLEKCLQPIQVGKKQILPEGKAMCTAYFYLAALGIHDKDVKKEQLENWINLGLAICGDSRLFNRFSDLKRQISGTVEDGKTKSTEYGKIKFFNVVRGFGVIEASNGSTFLFLSNALSERIRPEGFYNFAGKNVSYKLVKDPKKADRMIAIDVMIEPNQNPLHG
jgi:tetratricopeptide (TPR) repeat protein/cold shock CspA family protein